ncbi:MAG: tetratricopeptide repeat protein [bacterium]
MLDFFSSNDPEKIVERSNKLRIESKFDKAEQLLKKNIKNSKSDFIILLELARVQFEQEKVSEAVISLRSAYFSNPESLAKVVDIAEDFHYRPQAKKDATAVILFELYVKKRDFENFKKIFSTLSNSEAVSAIQYFEKSYQNIKENKTVEQLTKKDIEIYIILGILYLNNRQFKEAKPICETIFKTQPKERDNILSEYLTASKSAYGNPAPHMAIGDLYVIINDKDKAINYYQKAVSIDPSLKESVAKKFEESIKDTSEISDTSKFSLVDLYLNKHDYMKAIDIIRELIADKQEVGDDITRRAYQIVQGKNDLVEGYKLLADVLLLKKDTAGVVTNLSKISELTDVENQYILKIIDKMISKDMITEDLLVLKSRILIKTGNLNEAARLCEKVYEMNRAFSFELEQILNEILNKDSFNITGLSLMSRMFIDRDQPEKAKQILEYISSQENPDLKEIAHKYYLSLHEKFPDDIDVKLHLSIILIELGKIREAESLILETVKIQPNLFYEIMPKFYAPSKKSKDIAESILKILDSVDKSKLDSFLYNYSYAEISYLAGLLDQSISIVLEMLEKNPDKEDAVLELVDRMKELFPQSERIAEFEFKYYLSKKNYSRSLSSLMQLYNNKQMIGHVLDNLYVLYKQVPDDANVITNILRVLDDMGLYEKIIQESTDFLAKTANFNSGSVKFYVGKAYAKKNMLNDSATYLFQAMALDKSVIDDSMEILRQLLKIDFSSLRVHYTLAHGLNLKALTDDAIEELFEVMKIDSQQIDLVIRDLEKWYEDIKRNPKLTLSLAKLYMEKGYYDKAISKVNETYEMDNQYIDSILSLLKSAVEHDVEDGHILFTIGKFYEKKGLYKLASDYLYNAMSIEISLKEAVIAQLQSIINKQPEEADARFSLAQVYKDMHNYMQTITLLRQIEMINPSDRETVIGFYQEMLANEPNNTYLLISMGDSYMNMGSTAEAIETFRKAININPLQSDEIIDKILDFDQKTTELQLFLSELYFKKQDFDSAVNWLNLVYVTDTDSHDKIMNGLNRIIGAAPGHQSSIMLLSLIYFDTGKYNELIDLSHEVFEKSTVPDQKFRFGVLLSQSYRNTNREKLADDITLKMMKEDSQLYYAVVFQIYEQEKSKKAAKMKQLYTSNPNNEENLLKYAEYLIKQQDFESAVKIMQVNFKNPDSLFERSFLLSKIYEKQSNIIYALELASPLRKSQKVKHIAHLVGLLKKLGYYGEAENILKEKQNLSNELGRFQYMQNVFNDYKVIA